MIDNWPLSMHVQMTCMVSADYILTLDLGQAMTKAYGPAGTGQGGDRFAFTIDACIEGRHRRHRTRHEQIVTAASRCVTGLQIGT